MKLSAPNVSLADFYAAAPLIEAGQIDPGPIAEDFAIALAEEWGVPRSYVLLTNSCTTAIGLVARHLGGLWHVPVLTWPGSYCAIPNYRLVDTHHDGHLLRRRIQPEQQVYVNLWGRTKLDWPREINDSAHCLFPKNLRRGLEYDLGPERISTAVCFSFGPTKEITTLRGGAIVWDRAEELRDHIGSGARGRVPTEKWGVNGTITEIGAKLGLEQLSRVSSSALSRRSVLKFYEEQLKDSYVELITREDTHSGHLAVVSFEHKTARDTARRILDESGIPWGHHYPLPPYGGTEYEEWRYARRLSQRVLTLPCHTKLTSEDFRRLRAALDRVKCAIRPASAEQTTE